MRGKLICTTLKALEHVTEGYTAYGKITRILFCKRKRKKWTKGDLKTGEVQMG